MKLRGRHDIVRCSNCGYRFSVMYSRTFACSECSKASFGCKYVKCPRCSHEFVLSEEEARGVA